MKKILQISNYMYPHVGGTEQIARDIAHMLREASIEQKIICFNEDAQDGMKVCRRHETVHDTVDDVEVIRCGCYAKIRSQSLSLTYPQELKELLDAFAPDIVIFHYPNPFGAHWLLKYLCAETKLILYWHLDIVKQSFLRIFFRKQNDKLIDRADRVVATSPNYVIGSPWLKRISSSCVIIPNCINAERLKKTERSEENARRIREEHTGKIMCLAIGRHVKYKGFRYLIRAARLLDDRFQVYLIGTGKETGSLKREAAGDAKIHFLGRVPDEELKGWLTAADIFCFPSITKNEAFGLALAEAMYYEKPAVTFTIPGSGVNFVNLHGETGIEVPNRDVYAYAKALKRLADDPALRRQLGQNGRKRVEERFMPPQFNEKIMSLIDSLDNQPNKLTRW